MEAQQNMLAVLGFIGRLNIEAVARVYWLDWQNTEIQS